MPATCHHHTCGDRALASSVGDYRATLVARQPWDQTGDAFTAVVQKWNFTVKQKPPFKIDMKTWMAWLKDPDYKERMTKKHTLIRGEPYTFDHVLPEKWKALCLYPAAKISTPWH